MKVFIGYLLKPKTLGLTGIIIIILGIVDDIKPLRARVIPVQLLAAVVVVATGTRIIAISKPFQATVALHLSMMYFLGDILAFIISVVWIVGMTNAINFIDGLDGLAAGVGNRSPDPVYCRRHKEAG